MSERREVLLRASSLNALRQLIHTTPLDLDCGGPRRHPSGVVMVNAFVNSQDLIDIEQAVGVEAIEIMDIRSAEEAEVGKGDRYSGGRLFPRGFGRKVEASA